MIDLYSYGTPNGQKASIMIEEVDLPYTFHRIDIGAGDQKTLEFLAINPNGRIPAIVDRDANDFAVFESGAILIYLAEKAGKLLPTDPQARSEVLQWLMFQMGGIGPMQGQASHFVNAAPEHIPYAVKRYQDETRRLYEVLETRLADRDYLAGEYSIADISAYPWVVSTYAGIDRSGLPNLSAWVERISARPAVRRGMDYDWLRAEKSVAVKAAA